MTCKGALELSKKAFRCEVLHHSVVSLHSPFEAKQTEIEIIGKIKKFN